MRAFFGRGWAADVKGATNRPPASAALNARRSIIA